MGVSKDAEQPGSDPCRIPQLAKFALGRAKRLLRKVFRIDPTTGQPESELIERRVVLVYQLLHGPLTAGQLHVETSYKARAMPQGFIPQNPEDMGTESRRLPAIRLFSACHGCVSRGLGADTHSEPRAQPRSVCPGGIHRGSA